MKLYELKRNTYFQVADGSYGEQVFHLDHIDGAYSMCYSLDNKLYHFSVGTPVREYEIKLA